MSPCCGAICSTLRKRGPTTLTEWRSCAPRLAPSTTAFGYATATRTWPVFKRNSSFHGGGKEGLRENLFCRLCMCWKKPTSVVWPTNTALHLPRATYGPQQEGQSQQMPGLPLQRANPQSPVPGQCSASRASWGWAPAGGSQDFSSESFAWEIRWAKGVLSTSFSKGYLLTALSWNASANKTSRKPAQ